MSNHAIVPARKWKNGRKAYSRAAKQIEAHQEAMERVEMATVLAQPHRRNSRSQLRESALGRVCDDNRLVREIYDAGLKYAGLRGKWLAAKGAPMPDRLGGSGADIDPSVVHAWGKAIARCEQAVLACRWIDPMAYGPAALGYCEWVCLDNRDPPVNVDWRDLVCGLLALAVELGYMDQKVVDRRGIRSAYQD